MVLSPQNFFETSILAEGSLSEKTLRAWLSAPAVKAMVSAWGLMPPRIWMLTGLYELKNASMCEIHSNEPNASIHASAEAITALTGVPVGGAVEIGNSSSLKVQLQWPKPLVWAAQYQEVDARYIKEPTEEQTSPQPLTFSLYPDRFSKGMLRNADGPALRVEVTLGAPLDDDFEDAASPERHTDELNSWMALFMKHYVEPDEED